MYVGFNTTWQVIHSRILAIQCSKFSNEEETFDSFGSLLESGDILCIYIYIYIYIYIWVSGCACARAHVCVCVS